MLIRKKIPESLLDIPIENLPVGVIHLWWQHYIKLIV